jgi:hypothetical protein
VERLMRFLVALGYDVETVVKAKPRTRIRAHRGQCSLMPQAPIRALGPDQVRAALVMEQDTSLSLTA